MTTHHPVYLLFERKNFEEIARMDGSLASWRAWGKNKLIMMSEGGYLLGNHFRHVEIVTADLYAYGVTLANGGLVRRERYRTYCKASYDTVYVVYLDIPAYLRLTDFLEQCHQRKDCLRVNYEWEFVYERPLWCPCRWLRWCGLCTPVDWMRSAGWCCLCNALDCCELGCCLPWRPAIQKKKQDVKQQEWTCSGLVGTALQVAGVIGAGVDCRQLSPQDVYWAVSAKGVGKRSSKHAIQRDADHTVPGGSDEGDDFEGDYAEDDDEIEVVVQRR